MMILESLKSLLPEEMLCTALLVLFWFFQSEIQDLMNMRSFPWSSTKQTTTTPTATSRPKPPAAPRIFRMHLPPECRHRPRRESTTSQRSSFRGPPSTSFGPVGRRRSVRFAEPLLDLESTSSSEEDALERLYARAKMLELQKKKKKMQQQHRAAAAKKKKKEAMMMIGVPSTSISASTKPGTSVKKASKDAPPDIAETSRSGDDSTLVRPTARRATSVGQSQPSNHLSSSSHHHYHRRISSADFAASSAAMTHISLQVRKKMYRRSSLRQQMEWNRSTRRNSNILSNISSSSSLSSIPMSVEYSLKN